MNWIHWPTVSAGRNNWEWEIREKKDIKDTIVSFLFFAVVFGVVWSLYFFRVMIVRGIISIAPSSMLMCTIGVVWSRGIRIISV